MDVEKEIEEIKARLRKVEKHVESCEEHEKIEGHGPTHGGSHAEPTTGPHTGHETH
jgi:hypothetical protein